MSSDANQFLAAPMELLELRDGQSIELSPTRWELGNITIHPRYPNAPLSKVIRALRLHVDVAQKPAGVPYWDLTSTTLIVQLVGLLPGIVAGKRRVRIVAQGVAPAKRFTVAVF